MRIIAKPAFSNREQNPYQSLLYEALEGRGVEVFELTFSNAIRRSYDLFHVHWPDLRPGQRSWLKAVLWSVSFLLNVAWMKARGAKLVWTVHNVQPHDLRHPRLTRWFWSRFLSALDGAFFLSATGRALALEQHPALRDVPGVVTPHGHYRPVHPSPPGREEAREELGLGDGPVVGYVGLIRRYKSVPALIAAFTSWPEPEATLLVAGSPDEEGIEDEVRGATRGDPRIRLDLRFLPDEELEAVLRASDLTVLPYSDILHSGSAVLSLSLDTPILVPGVGAMKELQALVGSDWVRTYEGVLDAEILAEAVAWARQQRPPRAPLDPLEWSAIAEATEGGYQAILDGDRR